MRLRVPPSLDPLQVERHYPVDQTGEQIVDAVIANLAAPIAAAQRRARAIVELAQALPATEPSPSVIAARMRKAAESAAATLKEIDSSTAKAREVADQIRTRVPAHRNPAVSLAEIRTAARALDPRERRKLTAEAIKGADDDTMAALLSGPAFLSGFEPAEQADAKRRWLHARHPEDADRLGRLDAAVQDAELAARVYAIFLASAANGGADAAEVEAARRAEAAQAAVDE